MTEAKTPTRAAQLHEAIRSDVLRGELPPGTPLRLAALAARYGAGQSVVREALGRLAENNLAVLVPNQGFRVVDASRADLVALTELRVMIECEALRRSIAHGDVRWEAAVVSAHHVLERATFMLDDSPGSTEEWSRAHAGFHDALVSACDNARMLALTTSLRDGAEIYRQLGVNARFEELAERDIPCEHRQLMELSTARDLRAVDALARHIQRTTDDLITAGAL
ncbi:GntR family transcriptional regulator [Pseudonocardia broussonetiae]|uniref:GntR family transcriptional regulator n=1 Tax=Pseudonocardia broussonetiae TaxID=2736640 RepID=A0A6M6JJN7_9PSEU|nr:GntR family transcriptional regulator [Pseudonocardia broussonetiae]QJY47415.1 GntR family transcriptional regulator [Pseudonocardia broussonetiae]